MGYGHSGGVFEVYEVKDLPKFNEPGEPNARYDLMKPRGKGPEGQKQSRYTDAKGHPKKDIDYNHSGDKHSFPHQHNFKDGKRGDAIPMPKSLSNKEARDWYKEQIKKIGDKLNKNKSLEEQAKDAHNMRNDFKQIARDSMSDRKMADKLEKDFPLKQFDELMKKYKAEGLYGDALFQAIIDAAMRANPAFG